jgi:hypothetical protein
MPKLQIISPAENVNYNANPISFVLRGEVMGKHFINQSSPFFYCSLDDRGFHVNAKYEGDTADGWLIFRGEISLRILANGTHSVSVSHISNSDTYRGMFPVSVKFNVTNSKSAIVPAAPKFAVEFGGNLTLSNHSFPCANFTIKNQPLPTYTQDDLKNNLIYYIRWKESSQTSWANAPAIEATESASTDYTLPLYFGDWSGLVDFQMSAQLESFTSTNVFISQRSEWSNSQTITMPTSSASPTVPMNEESNPVSIPLTWALGVIAVLVILVGSLLLFRWRRGVSKQQTELVKKL